MPSATKRACLRTPPPGRRSWAVSLSPSTGSTESTSATRRRQASRARAAHEIGHVLGIGQSNEWYAPITGRDESDPHRPAEAVVREFEYWDSVRVARYGDICREYTEERYRSACGPYSGGKVPVHAIRSFHWNLCIAADVMSEVHTTTHSADTTKFVMESHWVRDTERRRPITTITLAALKANGFRYDRAIAEPPRLTRFFTAEPFFEPYDERASCKRGWGL